MRPAQILEGLNETQRAAVLSPAGPLVIEAGAGTGKTRTLTSRIAFRIASGQVPAGAVLAVTHSTRAAGQLREGLRQLKVPGTQMVATRTIHAAALNQLRYFWADLAEPTKEPVVCPDQYATVRDIARTLRAGVRPEQVTALVQEISWAKTTLHTPTTYAAAAAAAGRRPGVRLDVVAEVFSRYERALATRRLLDHTDLLTRAHRAIRDVPHIAQAVHRRAAFLVVDEYQDVDPAQQQLLDAWLDSRHDITVVGDARQAIYAFKGADPGLIATFSARYPGAQALHLADNYRSTPQILAAANRVARAAADPGAPAPVDLVSHRPDGPTPVVHELADALAERGWVCTQVRSLLECGHSPAQVAVLVRDNLTVRAVADQLTGAGIPVFVPGSARFFDLPEIAAVRTLMRRELQRGTDLSGPGLLRQVLADMGFDRSLPPDRTSAAAPTWRSRHALLRWVEALPAAELLDASHLLAELDRAAEAGHHVEVDAVTVSTVHAAKGLEFDTVFSLGWDASWRQGGQQGNLAYVALTRARRMLTLTYAATNDGRPVGPSRFLAAVAGRQDDHVPRPPRGAGGVRACRRCRQPLPPESAALGACSGHLTGDAARTWAALLAWRSDQATIAGLRPTRILTDATALALIAARPRTLDDLAHVQGVGRVTLERYGQDLLTLVTVP